MPEETQNTDLKEHKHLCVHSSSIVHNSQDLETARVPISRWVSEKAMVYYTVEYYSAIKKKEILPFVAAWMDLESIMLSEISQSEIEKYHMISLICRIRWTK